MARVESAAGGNHTPCETLQGERPRPDWRALLSWGLLAGLVAVQFLLFRRHALREVVWAYPDHYDQAYYLQQAYALYERMRAVGCWQGLVEHVSTPRPTGMLFPVPAALLFLLVGPSRLAALSTCFACFALFQATLFATLRWLTRRWEVGFVGVGLLLAAVSPFMANGGLFDYRIDFSAMCLFGVVLCLVARSRLFASPGWSAAVGVGCAWLVLCRFLTSTYLAGIFCVVVLFLAVRRWRHRASPELRRSANRQLLGLALAGVIVAAAAGPALWVNRKPIHDYYIVGHVIGAEKAVLVRAANVRGAVEQLLFYPRSVAVGHLGGTFLVLAGVLLGTSAALGLARLVGRKRRAPASRLDWAGIAVGVLGGALVPYALLTLDEVKSVMACNILVAPTACLVLLAVAAASRVRPAEARPRLRTAGFALLAAAALAAGLATQVSHYRAPGFGSEHRRDLEAVARLYDRLAEHCRAEGRLDPRVSVTTVQSDCLAVAAIPPYAYERHRLLMRPHPGKLGNTIFAVTAAEALDDLRQSDVVILAGPTGVVSSYPFDDCMKELYPRLKRFCDGTLTPLGQFVIFGQRVNLYARPRPGPAAGSG